MARRRGNASAYALAIAVAVSTFVVASLLTAILLLVGPLGGLEKDTTETITGYVGLVLLGVGGILGMKTGGLSGWRAWLVVAVAAAVGITALFTVADMVIAWSDDARLGAVLIYGVPLATAGWLLRRRRGPSSNMAVAVSVGAIATTIGLLLVLDDRPDDWVIIAVPAALLTAFLIVWGLSVQRQDPGRRWPIIVVGLVAGLVAGLAMLQATWAEGRWPQRRRLIDTGATTIGAILMVVAAWAIFEPPFGLGPTVEAGRIERPVAGYALTLPEPWRIEDTSGVREVFGEELPIGAGIDLLAASGDGDATAMVMVIEDDSGLGPELMALGFQFALDLDPDYEDVGIEEMSLSSGAAHRIDAVNTDGRSMSFYPLSADGKGTYVLVFAALEPPHDRWRSIADTFEFLPPEERGPLAILEPTTEPASPGEAELSAPVASPAGREASGGARSVLDALWDDE